MTLYEYLQLNDLEQASAIWDQGRFLAHRKEELDDYALYEIEDFFVEVTYSNNANKILPSSLLTVCDYLSHIGTRSRLMILAKL